MPFEDIVISGSGSAMQRLPLDGEAPKSTIGLMGDAIRAAVAAAGINRRDIDAVFTHRPPAGDSFLLFGQKLVAELKISPTTTTTFMNHGAGMLSSLKYGALLLERGLARHVLCASGDAAATWLTDPVAMNAAHESDAHFEAPYGPITPVLYGQIGQRFVHDYGITEEDLAQVCVDLRAKALDHPDAQMRERGPLTIEQVLASPMIASPSRLLHCAPYYKGARAGAVILSRREDSPNPDGPHTYVRGVGETVTHEHISGRLGLRGFGPTPDSPNLTVTGAAPAMQLASEFAGFGIDTVDVVTSPVPFAFLVMMLLEDLGICPRGGSAEFVHAGGLSTAGLPGSPAILTNGGSLSFGQSYLNCVMDQLLEALQQLDATAAGQVVEGAQRAVVHSHGGVVAANAVVLLERV